MDPEFLFAKFFQSLKEQRYTEAKETIYQAHREGMPAGHILVKLVNRSLDRLQQERHDAGGATSAGYDLEAASRKYYDCLVSSDRANAQKLLGNLIARGAPANDLLLKVLTPAMDGIGELQSRQAINIAQIFMAAKIVDDAFNRISPMLKGRDEGGGVKVVIGNAFGDHHALGRKIVATFLRSYGFDVIDLGMSVPNEKLVDEAVRADSSLICVSAFLLATAHQLIGLRRLLTERSLGHIKLLVGGAPFSFDNQLYKRLGCDAYAPNALAAVKVAKQLTGLA